MVRIPRYILVCHLYVCDSETNILGLYRIPNLSTGMGDLYLWLSFCQILYQDVYGRV
jgi:hypothetical protein